MNTTIKILAKPSLAMSLCCLLFATMAAAQEVAGAPHVPLKSMNQAEYESYHQQLDSQVRSASRKAAQQGTGAEDKSVDPQADNGSGQIEDKNNSSGYGKGYRSRMQSGNASSGRAGGYRSGSGSMSRGGGGRYR